jgi:serine/threonine-protein kinase RsbW
MKRAKKETQGATRGAVSMEEMKAKMELRIPSVLGFEKLAMDFAASAARLLKFSDDRIEDLKTAVSEACINAIEHGNRLDASVKVGVSLTLDRSGVQVDVHDEEGQKIGQVPTPNIDAKVEGREPPRGWGIFLIKNLVDEVQFESRPEGGNVVKMIIHLEKINGEQ